MENSVDHSESKVEPGYTIEPYDEGHVLVRPKNGSIPSIVRIGSLNLPSMHYDSSTNTESLPRKEPHFKTFAKSILSRLSYKK